MARKPKNSAVTAEAVEQLQSQLAGLERRLTEFELQQAMTNYHTNAWLNGYRQVLEHFRDSIVALQAD